LQESVHLRTVCAGWAASARGERTSAILGSLARFARLLKATCMMSDPA
jgi:hypothetical protein